MINREISMTKGHWLLVAVIFMVLPGSADALSYKYSLINFPNPTASTPTVPVAISANGTLVLGDSAQLYDATDPDRFIYDTATHQYKRLNISIPGATLITTTGINSNGAVVGSYTDGSGTHGFLYHNGWFQHIDFPGAIGTNPIGINDYWTVVGSYINGAHVEHSFLKRLNESQYHGFDFPAVLCPDGNTPNNPVFAAGINNNGAILGTTGSACIFEYGVSVLDNHGIFTKLSDQVIFRGLNTNDEAAGTLYGGHPSGTLTVYNEGKITTPNPNGLGAFNFGAGVDTKGDIVGWYAQASFKGPIPINGGFLATPTP
jgi:probable HAF family extracellular repeat protein